MYVDIYIYIYVCVCIYVYIDSHLASLIIEVGSFRAWFFPLTQKHQVLGSGKGLARVWQGFGEGLAKVLARVWRRSGKGLTRVLARIWRGTGESLAKVWPKTMGKPRYRSN